jgi:predicted metal-dependent phosphotriesterase family hydrolase
MVAAITPLEQAAVRAVAAANPKLGALVTRHQHHHHRETMVARHLLQQAVVVVEAVVQAR